MHNDGHDIIQVPCCWHWVIDGLVDQLICDLQDKLMLPISTFNYVHCKPFELKSHWNHSSLRKGDKVHEILIFLDKFLIFCYQRSQEYDIALKRCLCVLRTYKEVQTVFTRDLAYIWFVAYFLICPLTDVFKRFCGRVTQSTNLETMLFKDIFVMPYDLLSKLIGKTEGLISLFNVFNFVNRIVDLLLGFRFYDNF